MADFSNKTLFITGAASGIGAEIVKQFRSHGANVCFCDIDIEKGEALATLSGAHFIEADTADESALESAFLQTIKMFGDVDIVINNVGISAFKPLIEISVEEFDRVLSTNLRSAFITSRLFARHRNSNDGRAKYGRIINMSSTRHIQSEPHSEAYAASKGGVVALTHALALSLAEFNITVNSISPGWIDNGNFGDISEADHRQHPSGRVGTPSDIARICLFLADPANDFINGENIVVDGGMTKKMIYLE